MLIVRQVHNVPFKIRLYTDLIDSDFPLTCDSLRFSICSEDILIVSGTEKYRALFSPRDWKNWKIL